MAISTAEARTANEAETKLLHSALVLFSEKGYEGTSIREIIEGAGVTRPVLYYYFANKEDLFRRLVEHQFAQLAANIEEIRNRVVGCKERLRAIICQEFLLAEEHPEVVRLILQVFFSLPLQGPSLDKGRLAHMRFRLLEEIMREGLDRRELSGGDAKSLALVFMGVMDMHIMAKSNRPEITLTPALGHELVDFFCIAGAHRESPLTHLVSPYAAL